jgi:Glycosyl transferase family 21
MKTEFSDIQAGQARDSVRSRNVFTSEDLIVFVVLSVLRLAALAWFLWHWLTPAGWWYAEKLMFLGATLLLVIGLGGNQLRWASLTFMKRPVPMEPRRGLRVAAVTTCVPDLEPPEILAPTLEALASLDYPHDTWLLDEGDGEVLRDLCRSVGVRHFSRRGMPCYQTASGTFASRSKHGNYNAWLQEIGFENYDILIAFDPDHMPVPEYASAVLGFFEDPQIAYVQAPQVYRNQSASLVARGAAEETYAYYSATEMASYGVGETVLTGSHSVHRLTALREFGGFPDHTAEDLLQTVYYRTRGWQGVYVPRILATGLAPEEWSEYLTQQVRWARSVLDIKFRHLPATRGSLSRESLIEFLQGFGYLQDGLLAAGLLLWLLPLLAAGTGQKTYEHLASPSLAILVAVLFVSDLFRQRFYLQPDAEAGIHWRAGLLRVAKWPFVWKAFWLVVHNKPFPYVVTPKTKSFGTRRRLMLPHGVVAAAVAISWAIGVILGNVRDGSLHILAAALVAVSFGLILLEGTPRHGRN